MPVQGGLCVVVVARIEDGEDILCAFMGDGNVVRATVNAEREEAALDHIREHLAAGCTGPQLCALDCKEAGGGAVAPD